MFRKFRKLSEAGVSEFRNYIRDGAKGSAPIDLLDAPKMSEPFDCEIELKPNSFDDRYMFGVFLKTLLKKFDPKLISGDVGLWSGLALLWFDHLCPVDAKGNRSTRQEYLYILSSDYRHYYRHLVRSPWQLVKDHGEASRFLLISPRKQNHPLSVHGEILEQIGARQQVLSSQPIIRAANKLYFDSKNQRPRNGVAGAGRGSARRFGLVLRQLDLTYDPNCMSDNRFISILPDEFEKWRRLMASERSNTT